METNHAQNKNRMYHRTIQRITGKYEEAYQRGMNVARLNFSHGDFEEHGNRIKNIRQACKELGKTRSDPA